MRKSQTILRYHSTAGALRSLLLLLLLCLSVVASALQSSAAPAPLPSLPHTASQQSSALIAFLRGDQLWLMNDDGSDQRQITEYDLPVRQFSWSPSGRYLAVLREGELSLFDTEADDLRDLVLMPGELANMRSAYGSSFAWAVDADVLLIDVHEGSGVHRLSRVETGGAIHPLNSYVRPPTCGGLDGPAPITAVLMDGEELGSAIARGAYGGLVWWSDRDLVFVNSECPANFSFDLTSGATRDYPDTTWLAGTPDGMVLVQDAFTNRAKTLGLFDPVTGIVMPIPVGYVAPNTIGPFALAPDGSVVFISTTEGPESAFSFVSDDIPFQYHDNTTEFWRTSTQHSEPELIAAVAVYDAGIPTISADGSIIAGIVDNPTALMDVDQTGATAYDTQPFAEHHKVIRIDPSGTIAVLATGAYRPRLQPNTTPTSNTETSNSTAIPQPTATLVTAQPITTYSSVAPIVAITCTHSYEGFWISGGGGMNMPDGCAWSNGAVFTLSGPNGEDFGSCTISDFFCQGDIRMPTDVEVTVTLDESTIPEGYAVVDGNPKQFLLPTYKLGSDSEQWLFVSMPDEITSQPDSAQQDTPQFQPPTIEVGAPIIVITCDHYADDFFSDQGIGFDLPEGCVFSAGHAITVVDVYGNDYGTCVSNENGYCRGVTSLPIDVDLIVTLDPASIPDGYEIDGGNPKTVRYPSIAIGTEGPLWLFVALPAGTTGGDSDTNTAASAPVIEPGSNWIAYVGDDGNIWLMQPDGSAKTQVTFDGSPDAWYQAPSWSHDGTMLVFTRPIYQGLSQVYLLADGTVGPIPGIENCSYAAFMPGDTQIAMTCAHNWGAQAGSATLQSDPSMGLISIANLDGTDWHVRAAYNPAETHSYPTPGSGLGAMVPTSISVAPDGTIYFGFSTQMTNDMNRLEPGSNTLDRIYSPLGIGLMNGHFVGPANALLIDACAGCYIHSREDPQHTLGWMDRDGTLISTLLVPEPTLSVGVPTISSDGRTLVYAVADQGYPGFGNIQSLDLVSGAEMTIGRGMQPAWQPNPAIPMQIPETATQPTSEAPQPEPANANATVPPEYLSIWNGTGIQESPHGEWPLSITIVSGGIGDVVGTSSYPEQACGGNLILHEVTANSIILYEQLTYGLSACADAGTITLSNISGATIQFAWNGIGPLGTPSTASGTLYRPDGGTAQSNPSSMTLPDYLIGTNWTGAGDQQSPANTWPVTISFSGGAAGEVIGTIDYPSLGCGGELILVTVYDDSFGAFQVLERITYGQDNCIDGGTFVFTLSEGAFILNFRWTSPSRATTATGRLDPT